ncbi:tyrosine-protein phosphatase [Clostridium mediterraneense]|uniref:tyrosine-protein phosphatase n=1 Tax=Clostridium mediterraneense TaxID=1805472 RepID=UPI000832C635|nr:CpsB/CapC family capsule biosynthesis tyrosine phosphatase [Clostridium mediterraneense]
MIDIHSHIISKIDDGSKTDVMSISMLKRAADSGTKKIIATPHYFTGRFEKPLVEVKKRVEELRQLAKENNIDLEIYAGQEVYFTRSLLEDLDNGNIGTLNDSRYMLIEFNMAEMDKEIFNILYELKIKGIKPIIAHPERYRVFNEDPSKINEFIDEGYLFQMNANSIEGRMGKEAKKTAEIFLKNNIYSFIGSDAHSDRSRNTDITQYKDLIEKINPSFLEDSISNGEKLLNNKEIIFNGYKVKEKKKGLFSFFRR